MTETPTHPQDTPDARTDAAAELGETVAETVTTEATKAAVPETFADFNVLPEIVESLANAGIHHPFPIQAMTLQVALGGGDVIGQAKTGTGKTLGFGIPVLQRVAGRSDARYADLAVPGAPQALVVAPTRELAVQVSEDLSRASAKRDVRIATIYGGRAYEPQIEQLKAGVEVVVGTPGRIIDLHRQRFLDLSNVRIVVLDEADEMLDLGFLPDVERLLSAVPAVRQTMLFSATMPGPVVSMARRYMSRPTHIRATDPDDDGSMTKRDIRQVVYRAHALNKDEVVARILQAEGRSRAVIFTKTKRSAAKLADELIDRGFAAAPLHGDLGQGAREQALRAFRNGKVDVLVATDVAARGIDVDDVSHVINFQCPEDEKTYLHRIGRTGRAGNKGIAVTFVDWDDLHRWQMINRALELDFHEPVETYSSSKHLYEDLNIPEGTKGRLPKHRRTLAGLEAEKVEDLDGKGGREPREGSRGGRGAGRSSRGRGDDAGRGASTPRESGRSRSAGGRGGRSAEGSRSDEARTEGPQGQAREGGSPRGAEGGEGAASTRAPRKRTRRRGGSGRSAEGSASAE
ncbi:DEAD/DEAH box helicase [Falsarthrobacter nasiphocae]|uniref:RNA helicase n=1 Tax=Falsarthrobacter nasiphocae TaxID=189863 RepID=A0AAE3YEY8_9MICC|nr:DEAD/DEAH box helicase [Falsarthrobacter nasiphocae]MDR6891467.1 superfamily II DNA/RNA helicase [Falsarthrobacter nasiphocae]